MTDKQVKVLFTNIVVGTTIGSFRLIHGKWVDGTNQPAPVEIIRILEEAHEEYCRNAEDHRRVVKVPQDKGDNL